MTEKKWLGWEDWNKAYLYAVEKKKQFISMKEATQNTLTRYYNLLKHLYKKSICM